ncbi:hypothetical protein [Streptomyces sp. H34-S4]|uniref:hypothetical protein n=1 Tax=Streptomyces sp. H34-S4 TaxID=2996463 RepID=UPI00226EB73D|nr:hypothetical protein [Streptomyces sp. H34-S4]MCY0939239.1 hypothetical protein [Streptomyces sp. H34-S4]
MPVDGGQQAFLDGLEEGVAGACGVTEDDSGVVGGLAFHAQGGLGADAVPQPSDADGVACGVVEADGVGVGGVVGLRPVFAEPGDDQVAQDVEVDERQAGCGGGVGAHVALSKRWLV